MSIFYQGDTIFPKIQNNITSGGWGGGALLHGGADIIINYLPCYLVRGGLFNHCSLTHAICQSAY